WVPRSEFAPAATDEYYWTDLVGCQLFGEDDSGQSVLLGEVIHVSDNGAHALLHVQRLLSQPDGSQTPQRNARGRPRIDLIPFVGAHVHTVDLAARQLLSNWPSSF
ncbi:MAG TPA: ribosome maturation factor RimM, partial [Burkholderiaceae bacterium]|nr:ribosome maturation factor RimM [Burkholderiaceae bacterium]